MGLEYIADVRERMNSAMLAEFVSNFISQPAWVVLSRNGSKITFKFSENALRLSGPEDFRLEADTSEIYVVFYDGTSAMESQVLDFIRDNLASMNIHINLEEP